MGVTKNMGRLVTKTKTKLMLEKGEQATRKSKSNFWNRPSEAILAAQRREKTMGKNRNLEESLEQKSDNELEMIPKLL